MLQNLRTNVIMAQYPIKAQPIPDLATRHLNSLSKQVEREKHPERFGLINRIRSYFRGGTGKSDKK